MTPTTALTRDHILAGAAMRHRYYLRSDADAVYDVVFVSHRRVPAIGYAISHRTGMIVRFEQTGYSARTGAVRCRITPARDTGDLAGTLAFDGESIGGQMPVDLSAHKGA